MMLLKDFSPDRASKGVDGELKNLIFAADGPKPRIVLRDAISNVIEIIEGADRCLVYDRALSPAGLSWGELTSWWEAGTGAPRDGQTPGQQLYLRLARSLMSDAEKVLFRTYCERYASPAANAEPALVPQVYLHYDPYTARELEAVDGSELVRQRMDFLLLPSDRRRVVIEVDGKHHYSAQNRPSPRLYSSMVAEDRELRFAGYEVFRFGGHELLQTDGPKVVREFFDRLLGERPTTEAG